MKFLRFSNTPIVGRYVTCSDKENEAIEVLLTSPQIGDLENGGWAKISYKVGQIRWPNQIVRLEV